MVITGGAGPLALAYPPMTRIFRTLQLGQPFRASVPPHSAPRATRLARDRRPGFPEGTTSWREERENVPGVGRGVKLAAFWGSTWLALERVARCPTHNSPDPWLLTLGSRSRGEVTFAVPGGPFRGVSMRAGVKIRCRAPRCWGSEARRGGPSSGGGASGSGGRRRAQLSARTTPRGGACTAVPAPPRAPAPPPERRAAVSEWHWQPVNPSARRPSSPVRGGCWQGAWLRQRRRRLLPPHQSAVRPARGPPGPSIGLRAPAAPARPLPNFPPSPTSAHPPASSSAAARRRRRSLPWGLGGSVPARPKRWRRRRGPREWSAQAGAGDGGRPGNSAGAEEQVERGRPAGRAAARRRRGGRVRAAGAAASATAAEPGASARRCFSASAAAEAGAGDPSAPPQPRAPPAGQPPPRAGGERAAASPSPSPSFFSSLVAAAAAAAASAFASAAAAARSRPRAAGWTINPGCCRLWPGWTWPATRCRGAWPCRLPRTATKGRTATAGSRTSATSSTRSWPSPTRAWTRRKQSWCRLIKHLLCVRGSRARGRVAARGGARGRGLSPGQGTFSDPQQPARASGDLLAPPGRGRESAKLLPGLGTELAPRRGRGVLPAPSGLREPGPLARIQTSRRDPVHAARRGLRATAEGSATFSPGPGPGAGRHLAAGRPRRSGAGRWVFPAPGWVRAAKFSGKGRAASKTLPSCQRPAARTPAPARLPRRRADAGASPSAPSPPARVAAWPRRRGSPLGFAPRGRQRRLPRRADGSRRSARAGAWAAGAGRLSPPRPPEFLWTCRGSKALSPQPGAGIKSWV